MTYQKLSAEGLITRIRQISRLSEFVEYLEEECRGDLFYFRGQPGDFPLRPKLARLTCRDGYDRLGTERSMLEAFQNGAHSYLVRVPENPWDVLALAQHHGMATRLLDWSKNPLASLWFAVERPALQSEPVGVVWVLCPSFDDILHEPDGSPLSRTELRIWEPRHVSPRIRAQMGVFTVHPVDEVTGEFRPLQEIPDVADKLTKVVFPADLFPKLRYELDRCGVNAASVYPDIDGLARYVEWYFSYSPDEGAY